MKVKNKTFEKCDQNYFPNIGTSPFSGLHFLELDESVKYLKYICICLLVLKNLNLLSIFFQLKNSFIKISLIKFQEFNASNVRT